jgi:amino acid transporter
VVTEETTPAVASSGAVTDGDEPVVATELRAGAIGLAGSIITAITSSGPTLSVMFIVQFIVINAGLAAPFAMVAGGVLMLLVALSSGQLAKHLPSASGFYAYVSRSLNPYWGFMATWLYLGAMIIAGAGVCLMLSGVMHEEVLSAASVNIPWWAWYLVFMGGVLFAASRGITLSIKTAAILGAGEMSLLLLLALWGIADPGKGGVSLRPFSPSSAPDAHSLFLGLVFAVFIYTTWETVAPIAEETRNPRRMVPRAMWMAVVFLVSFVVLTSYGLLTGYGIDNIKEFGTAAVLPGLTLAHRYWGPVWWLILIALINSCLGATLSAGTACNRMLYGMARSGVLPKGWASVSKNKIPTRILYPQWIIATVAGLVLGIGFGTTNGYYVYGLVFTLGTVAIYVFACAGVVKYYATEKRKEFNVFKHVVMPVVAGGVVLYVLYKSFVPYPTGPGAWALPLVGAWFVFGGAILVTKAIGRDKEWLEHAGQVGDDSLTVASEL